MKVKTPPAPVPSPKTKNKKSKLSKALKPVKDVKTSEQKPKATDSSTKAPKIQPKKTSPKRKLSNLAGKSPEELKKIGKQLTHYRVLSSKYKLKMELLKKGITDTGLESTLAKALKRIEEYKSKGELNPLDKKYLKMNEELIKAAEIGGIEVKTEAEINRMKEERLRAKLERKEMAEKARKIKESILAKKVTEGDDDKKGGDKKAVRKKQAGVKAGKKAPAVKTAKVSNKSKNK